LILSFDEPDLAGAAERLDAYAVDALPFGSVLIDAGGTVQFYTNHCLG